MVSKQASGSCSCRTWALGVRQLRKQAVLVQGQRAARREVRGCEGICLDLVGSGEALVKGETLKVRAEGWVAVGQS